MFGITCAPEKFQKIMEVILTGCEGCLNYIDDIIIYAGDSDQLKERVKKVLNRLKEYNVALNESKCVFNVTEIQFLGHKLSASGIKPIFDKVEAIRKFHRPLTMEETRSFLGLVNFVGKFIPNLATLTEPLRRITKKSEQFIWLSEQQSAFEQLKDSLTNDMALGYYDIKDRTQVYADASGFNSN